MYTYLYELLILSTDYLTAQQRKSRVNATGILITSRRVGRAVDCVPMIIHLIGYTFPAHRDGIQLLISDKTRVLPMPQWDVVYVLLLYFSVWHWQRPSYFEYFSWISPLIRKWLASSPIAVCCRAIRSYLQHFWIVFWNFYSFWRCSISPN